MPEQPHEQPTTLPQDIDLLVVASHSGTAADAREVADVAAIAAAFDQVVVLLLVGAGCEVLQLPEFPEILGLLQESGVAACAASRRDLDQRNLAAMADVITLPHKDDVQILLRHAQRVVSF